MGRFADAVSDMDAALALDKTLKVATAVRNRCAKAEEQRLEKLKVRAAERARASGVF